MLKIKPKVVIVILIIALLVSGLAIGTRYWTAGPNSTVVAKVNGEAITKDELYALLLEQAGQQGLNLLLAQKIVDLKQKENQHLRTEIQTALKSIMPTMAAGELGNLGAERFFLTKVKENLAYP